MKPSHTMKDLADWLFRKGYVSRSRALNDHIAANSTVLKVLKEVDECASYWSEYDVPLGIHERIKEAIALAEENKK